MWRAELDLWLLCRSGNPFSAANNQTQAAPSGTPKPQGTYFRWAAFAPHSLLLSPGSCLRVTSFCRPQAFRF